MAGIEHAGCGSTALVGDSCRQKPRLSAVIDPTFIGPSYAGPELLVFLLERGPIQGRLKAMEITFGTHCQAHWN